MSRWERHAGADGTPSRDYTYSKWHRYALPGSCAMIDLDGVDYCQSCSMPLMLVEVARDVGQDIKPVTVLRHLAQAANVPAIVVLYSGNPCTCPDRRPQPGCSHGIDVVRMRRVHPQEVRAWKPLTGEDLRLYIRAVHVAHIDFVHRRLGEAQ